MDTIYQKEALFDQLDETFEALKSYLYDAVGHEELHEVELGLFRRLQLLGRTFLECFIAESGSGYEEGSPPLSEMGAPMKYKGIPTPFSPYMSIFGEIRIPRAAYQHPSGGYVYPIDAHLNLPESKFSYLLQKWLQASAVEMDFQTAVDRFNEIFDASFLPEVPQRLGFPISAYVQAFYEQDDAPEAETEGSHIAVSADGKGVRILRLERDDLVEEVVSKARLGKGEKRGVKKESMVTVDFSFNPEDRDAREVLKALLKKQTQKEREQAKQERKQRREQGLPEPRAALNPHRRATLKGKQEAFSRMIEHVIKRDPTGEKRIIALLDGDPALETMLKAQVKAYDLEDRLDALILDIIHASDYVWDVGTALYGEKGPQRIRWVEQKLYAILQGKVGRVIGGLKQMRTKNNLRKAQDKAIQKTLTYFENHRHMMAYDIYLEKGYPIATGLVEGTCGSLVEDRMEHSGMRWSIAGAQAVLEQRAVRKNNDWEDFWTFYIDAEKGRLFPTSYKRVA